MHYRALLAAALFVSVAGCRISKDDTPVVVDAIGHSDELAHPLRHEDQFAAQTALAATAQGLVAFDAQGEVVGALAESWIVAEEGQSYIFRLRRAKWSNGQPIKAEEVARLLQARMTANPELLAGLRPEVRAMTDRVIEVRLETALPAFLQALAQPRLGLLGKNGGAGPYVGTFRLKRLYLTPLRDELNEADDGAPPEILPIDKRTLETGRAALAVVRFQNGEADLMLGGRFQDLLLIPHARLGATDVQADPAPGLFGFAIVGRSPFLADRSVRDALSRAIDREQFAKSLNLEGWTTAVTPLPATLDLPRPPSRPDWSTAPMERRIADARAAIERWKAAHGKPPLLRVALPAGAGATLLFHQLARDYARIGVRVDRVGPNEQADLRLIDAVAPFDSALWYLSRLDCGSGISCDPEASSHLDAARTAASPSAQADALAAAEALIVAHAGYIPLGQPIRWSLVSRRLSGFSPSPRAIHPLNRLIARPN